MGGCILEAVYFGHRSLRVQSPKRIVIGAASVPNPLIEFSAFAPVLAFPSRFLLDRSTSPDSNESQGVNWLFKSHRQVSSRVITVPFIYEITL